ncbi:MAG: NUDIX domain-containing protein [Rhodobacteraceae bacterium]|nr:NUDIX domain-containing protein [Paracoccaceae bacterium]
MDVFLTGLFSDPTLRAPLSLSGQGVPITLAGYHLTAAGPEGMVPHLVARPGGQVAGLRWTVDAESLGLLDHLHRVLGLAPQDQDGMRLWLAPGAATAAPWPGLSDEHRAIWAHALADLVALRAGADAARFGRRLTGILVQAAGRVRAGAPVPTTTRHTAQPGDVDVARRIQPYAQFFAVEEFTLTHRRFDGARSEPMLRAVFISGDAVTVLPYDPLRDRVLLIEQFRTAPLARGDAQPWMLEAIAGRIDPGETPADAARREAAEEAGLTLGALLPVAEYYASPGAMNEFLYSYVALCDLPDDAAGVFGKEDEAEDIRGHLLPLDRALDLVRSGEIRTSPLILTLFWLERERMGLIAAASRA